MRIAIYDCIVQGVTIIRGTAFVATLEAFLSRVLDFCLCDRLEGGQGQM